MSAQLIKNGRLVMETRVIDGGAVLIEDGKPLLGIWQGVYFCEFDGPRHRRYYIKVMADN